MKPISQKKGCVFLGYPDGSEERANIDDQQLAGWLCQWLAHTERQANQAADERFHRKLWTAATPSDN